MEAAEIKSNIDKSRIALWTLVAVPAMVLLVSGTITWQLETLKNLGYFTLISVAFFAFLLSPGFRKEGIVLGASFFWYVVFLCLSLVSLIWARLTYESSLYLAIHFANLVLLLLAANVFRQEKDLVLVLPSLTVVLSILSFIGFLERCRIVEPYGAYSPSRIISTMGNAGYLGGILAALIPAACAFALVSGKKGKGLRLFFTTILAWVPAAAGVVALFFTGARGGMITAAAGLVIFSILLLGVSSPGSTKANAPPNAANQVRKAQASRRFILLSIIVLSFVVFAGFIAFNPAFRALIRSEPGSMPTGGTSIFNNRLGAWRAAILIWLSEGPRSILVGRGMGSYYVLGFSYFPPDYLLEASTFSFKHAHNEYLQLLAEGGIFSLVSWLVLVFFSSRRAVGAARNPELSITARALAAAVAAGSISMLIQNLSDPLLRTSSAQVLYYFFTCISFALPLPAGSKIKVTELHVSTKIPKAFAGITVVLLLCFSLFQGYKSFQVDTALLDAFSSESMDAALDSFDKVLERDPDNIHALYEKLSRLSRSPQEAITTAERIEKVIPGFRQTALFKGMAESLAGRYKEASVSLRRYLSQESFNNAAWAHIITCEVMLADTDSAAASLGDFFRARHSLVMRWKEDYFNLEERELRLGLSGSSSRSYSEDGFLVAELNIPHLNRVARLLAAKRDVGFVLLLANVFIAMGDLFDELGYADIGLAYWDQAISMGGIDQASRNRILDRYRSWYDKAHSSIEAARACGDHAGEVQTEAFLEKYIAYMLRVHPDEALGKELQTLHANSREGY